MGFTTSRKTAAAALAGAVLLGGGIAAVAPAAAEDSAQFAATNWKKVWKNDLQQYADKRYYTKKKSDKKYATKTDLGNYYTKTQTDATYATKALTYSKTDSDAKYYTKAQADAKYAPYPGLIRGSSMLIGAPRRAVRATAQISFGVSSSAAPTVRYAAVAIPCRPGVPGTRACAERVGRLPVRLRGLRQQQWLRDFDVQVDVAAYPVGARDRHACGSQQSTRSPRRPATSRVQRLLGRCGRARSGRDYDRRSRRAKHRHSPPAARPATP